MEANIGNVSIFGDVGSQATFRSMPKHRWLRDTSSGCSLLTHDAVERENRFKIFEDNVKFAECFDNDGSQSYKLGINEFSDQTNDEF
ncbi:LOW QUALITY PROTEIN: hypothetical protein RJ639_004871 [Escallonia herrerae]|uniref:Cathepsin propeptide inhibitor domain-containing protein n=1 Tax=Escallonia herrerae TaxID=1293975 RepID=A0AA89AYI2_9ASTE|nr:LOW QUALITY PROTEIN: hypothetical protein RJ639_004871 [Escallonia herrerae]